MPIEIIENKSESFRFPQHLPLPVALGCVQSKEIRGINLGV